VGLLVGTILLVGALTFIPALALGPVVEHPDTARSEAGGTHERTQTHAPDPPTRGPPAFSAASRAAVDAVRKLDPRRMIRNPVMFVVEVGSAFTTVLFIHARSPAPARPPAGFILAVSAWLWFTVLFANFAEAMAEGRGKAQADTLRKARQDVVTRPADSRRTGRTRRRAAS
jgi:hypothetical protein